METQLRQKVSGEEDDVKRQKLSQEEEEEEDDVKQQKSKLCIISSSMTVDGDLTYDIFVADSDPSSYAASKTNDGFIPISPTFRLEPECTYKGFCVLGSKLYVFDSTDLLNYDSPLKSVCTLDLLSQPTLKRLGKTDLGRFHDLNQPKTSPLATPTPDGKKILAFSSFIRFDPFAKSKTAGENDFELYDPDVGKWQTLPGIRYDWLGYFRAHSNRGFVWIGGFTFIGTSTFVVQTKNYNYGTMDYDDGTMDDDMLIFSIDLDSIHKGWKQSHTFFGADALPFDGGRCLVIDDLLCVAPDGAYDIKKNQQFPRWCFFPQPSRMDDIMLLGPSAVTLLDDVKNGKFNFCNLEIGISTGTMHPHLVMNTFSCDLAKYREDKEKRGDSAQLSTAISLIDSFKFCVDVQCESFAKFGFFSF